MEATVSQSWGVPCSASPRWYVHLLPSLSDLAFLLPIFLLFYILPGTGILLSDGDTGWHIRTGEWILQNGSVPTQDLFSFTKPHQAWFAWEWGSDVLLAVVHRIAALAGVSFAAAMLLALVSLLLFRLIRRTSDNDVLALSLTFLAMSGSMLHWLARPHLFSWVFALLFSHAILSAEQGDKKSLLSLPVLMLLWVNLHGAFFVGVLLLLASAAGKLIETLAHDGQREWAEAFARIAPYLWCTLACCAVTFVNPYGWHLHQHVFAYLRNAKLLDNVQEYQSPNFHQPSSVFFECMLMLGVAAASWCLQYRKYASALTVVLWAHLALVSARNIPFFVFFAAPWVACLLHDGVSRLKVRFARASAPLFEMANEFQNVERIGRWYVLSAVGAVFLAACFAGHQPGFQAQFTSKNFPEQALPALRQAGVSRLFTTDQWGDYLIYRVPSQPVFMDGRSDFYGDAFLTKYQCIMSAQSGWEKELRQFAIDSIMVRPDAAIASVLKESRKWDVLFDDGSVILFRARHCNSAQNESAPDAAEEMPAFRTGAKSPGNIRISKMGNLGVNSRTNERRSL